MRLLDRWRSWRVRRRLAGPRILAAFAQTYPSATFVEIGANDGAQHDFLAPHIEEGGWSGLMVEPVPYVFERLRRNHQGRAGIRLVNAAVGERDERRPFYHLRDAGPDERASLPSWYDGIGSFSRETLLSHAPQMPDIGQRLVETEVETLTYATLLERHAVTHVDLLVIDTEGHDWEILRTVDLHEGPRLIVYEHFHLHPGARSAARAHAEAAGYATMEEGFDTFCLRPAPGEPDRLDRAWRRLEPGVPGVAKLDEPVPPADTSVPLPEGAEEWLREDNPRLADLRASYRSTGLPVTEPSRWSVDRVSSFLDLRRFRGDSLIMWHYREDPEATQRRYEDLFEHAAANDGLGLLSRLEEDGLFGCWTFEVGGRRVSRDLLDSVIELNFLERHLGLAGRERVTVLDIGAGYGRLAHRAITGLGNVAEWCCADAIPESAFVCEYHLRFRGLTPPARIVELGDVDELRAGQFDLAVNVHSFSEMPLAAVEWWLEQLARLEVPALFLVPNEAHALLSLEPDGERHDLGPALAVAGYTVVAEEQATVDRQLLLTRT